jgi:hypothetical protein
LAYCGEDVQQWLNVTYPGSWTENRWSIMWRPQSTDLTLMDFFTEGAPEITPLCSPSQDFQRSHGKTLMTSNISQCQHVKARSHGRLQASMTSDNVNMLRHARENVMQCPNIRL